MSDEDRAIKVQESRTERLRGKRDSARQAYNDAIQELRDLRRKRQQDQRSVKMERGRRIANMVLRDKLTWAGAGIKEKVSASRARSLFFKWQWQAGKHDITRECDWSVTRMRLRHQEYLTA